VSRPQLASLMLFGSPFLALAVTGAVAVAMVALAPGFVLPVTAAVWFFNGLLAGLGSAIGGTLCRGSDERRMFLGFVSFCGAVASYVLLCAIPYLLYGFYVMTFKFI